MTVAGSDPTRFLFLLQFFRTHRMDSQMNYYKWQISYFLWVILGTKKMDGGAFKFDMCLGYCWQLKNKIYEETLSLAPRKWTVGLSNLTCFWVIVGS
jgi:hypothetical protein